MVVFVASIVMSGQRSAADAIATQKMNGKLTWKSEGFTVVVNKDEGQDKK
jgi:hypothetical protein